MTVAELQQLLSSLCMVLRASQAAKVAAELEHLAARLQPFQGYPLKAFADFLEQAEAYSRGALAPKPKAKPKASGAKKSKPDAAAIEQACQRALELYTNAIDPSVTLEQIEAAAQALQDLDPPNARLNDLARQMGYTQNFKSKAEVLKAIRQKIVGRKGAFDRPNA